MPKIQITGVLPKANFGLETLDDIITTTTLNPNYLQEARKAIDETLKPSPSFQERIPGLLKQGPYFKQQMAECEYGYRKNPITQECERDPSIKLVDKNSEEAMQSEKLFQKVLKKNRLRINKDGLLKDVKPFKDSKLSKAVERTQIGLAIADPIIGYFNNRATQRRFNKWMSESSIPNNRLPITSAKDRGNYDMFGIFRPNMMTPPNEGMFGNNFQYPFSPFSAEYGGSMSENNNDAMNTFRIKITGLQQKMATGGQPMTYSGQLGYGINLGQKRIYTDMPPQKEETLNNTLKPVPREKANIEAEEGETAWGDLDNDGALEHMKIGGQKHTEGGTPLNVPENTFIFSDSKDMLIKDFDILKKFNMPLNKKGYTPAEIAKKYDTTKYKAIMEDKNSDSIKKATAQIMVKTFEKLLAKLALVQEEMKGFPQGIPEVVREIIPDLNKQQPESQAMPVQQMPSQEEQQEISQPQETGFESGGSYKRNKRSYFQPPVYKEYNDDEIDYVLNNIFQRQSGSLGMYLNGGTNETTTTTTVPGGFYNQTYSPKELAKLDDPEYQEFIKLLDELAVRDANGTYMLNTISGGKQKRLAELTTKFGFSRDDEGGIKGFKLIQNSTPGYTWEDEVNGEKKKMGWFGGMTPEMYEDKLVEAVYPPDRVAKMTRLEKRKLFLKELGIDASKFSDADLSNTKKFYTNKDFYKNTLYPAFTKTFLSDEYRKLKGDDYKFGFDHYDAFQWKQPVPPTQSKPTDQFVCVPGVGIETYDPNNSTHKSLTVYSTYPEAQQACYYGPANVKNVKRYQMPFKALTPDLVNLAATLYPKRYKPWAPPLAFKPTNLVLEEPRGLTANAFSTQYVAPAQMLAQYTSPQSLASNLSSLAGQAAMNITGNIMPNITSRNVDRTNQFIQSEQAREDKFLAAATGRAEDIYNKNVTADQNFDNAQRAYLNDFAKRYGALWYNRMRLGLLNNVNPMYPVDPVSGYSPFTGGYDTDYFNSVAGTGGGRYTSKHYRQLYEQYKKDGYTDSGADAAARKLIDESQGGGGNKPNMSDYNFSIPS